MTQIIGRIYRMVSSECDGVYIGSTTQQLNVRFNEHKSHYKRYLLGKNNYVASFEIVKFADAKLELVHEGVFDGRKDLEQFEGELIRTTPNTVNQRLAGRSKQEYYQNNKEALLQKQKQYGEANREAIRAYQNTKCTCGVCGGKFTNAGKNNTYEQQNTKRRYLRPNPLQLVPMLKATRTPTYLTIKSNNSFQQNKRYLYTC